MAIRFDQIELANTGHQLYPVLQASNATRLRVQSSNGYVDIGSGTSSSWGYILTDRPNFYIDKSVYFDGNIVAYGGDETAKFAKFIDSQNTAYYLDPADYSVLNGITMYTAGATDTGSVHLGRGGYVTFYGNSNSHHSIGSRDTNGNITDDLRINSYHNLHINLDSNNNNGNSDTVFTIGQHGQGTGTVANTAFSVTGHGIVTVQSNVKAPIYYDSADTGYYIDPASSTTSLSTKGDWRVPSGIAWSGEYTGGGKIQHHSNHWYIQSPDAGGVIFRNASAANKFIFDHTSGYGSASGDWRAPIFYDKDDTNYYTDPASTSIVKYLGRRAHGQGLLVGGYNNVGASHAKTNPIFTIGSSYLPTDTGLSNMYGIGYTRGDMSAMPGTNGWGMYVAADGDARIFLDGQNGGIGTALNSWRAPVFYDSDNTNYYLDPAGTSSINGLTVGGDLTFNGGNVEGYVSYTINMSDTSTYSVNKYYPVTIAGIGSNKICNFRIENALNSNVPSWSTHSSGFSLLLDYTTHGNGWGTHYQNRYIRLWSERYASVTILGGITQMSQASQEVLWLRGGGTYYLKANKAGLTVTPRSSTYTANGQSVSPTADNTIVNDVYSAADGSSFSVESMRLRNNIYHADDSDTYFGFTAANQMSFTAGNVTRLRIEGDVKVLGTTDLNIQGTSRRLQFTAGTGTVRTTTANNLLLETNSITRQTITTTHSEEAGSYRAPVFYDSADTNYYINPAGNTAGVLKGVVQFYTSSGNLRGYIEATETNDAHFTIATSGGEDIAFKDGGISGGTNMVVRGDGNVIITGNAYADAYYDDHDTNYYLDPAGTSHLNTIQVNDYIYHKGDTNTYIYFQSDSIKLRTGGDDRLHITNTVTTATNSVKITSSVGGKLHLRSTDTAIVDGDYIGNLYFEGVDSGGAADNLGAAIHAIATDTWNNTQAPAKLIFKTRSASAFTTALTLGSDQSATFAGSVTSGVYYDATDTNYYTDPSDQSRMKYLNLGTSPTSGVTSGYIAQIRGSMHMTNSSIDYVNQLHFYDNVRFLDDGNDSYLKYISGDSNTVGIKFYSNAGNNFKGYIYGDSDGIGFLDSDGNWSVRVPLGGSGLELRSNNNVEFTVNDDHTLSHGSSRAPYFYDSDNTNYYANPAGTSDFRRLKAKSVFDWDVRRITNPEGAAYLTTTSSVTGALLIQLPTARRNSNTMMQMTINVYQYTTGKSFRLRVGGYNYSANGYWYNVFAYLIGDAGYAQPLNVRFGDDGTRNWIMIGETNSSWSYPQFQVTDFQAGYSGISEDWSEGWATSVVTTLPSGHTQTRSASIALTSNNTSNWSTALYAPILYDSDNTAYYLDPASTSTGLKTAGEAEVKSLRLGNGFTLVQGSSTYARLGSWIDVNNIGLYSSHASGNGAHLYPNSTSDYGAWRMDGNKGGYNGITFSGSGSTFNTLMAQANGGSMGLFNDTDNEWYLEATRGAGCDMYYNGVKQLETEDGYALATLQMRSPIFYDSNDTTYYANLAATSQNSTSVSLKVRQTVVIGDSSTYNQNDGGWGSRLVVSDNVHSRIDVAQDADSMRASWYAHTGHAGSYIGTVTDHHFYMMANNTVLMTLDSTGFAQATGSMRAPLFYDSNDTTYYVDPAGTSQVNSIEFVGSTNNARIGQPVSTEWGTRITTDSGYILFGPANTSHAHIYTDRSNFYFNKQIQLLGGSLINQNDIRAQLFYDLNDTNYYSNPGGTSLTNITSANNFSVVAGNNNGIGFWGGTSGGSGAYAIYMSAHNGSNGGRVAGETTSDYNIYFKMQNGTNRGFAFKSGSTVHSHIDASGNIRTIADVIAFSSSDKNFKDELSVIENPLDKINNINGYNFTWNNKQTTYESGTKDIGVVAQEIEKVLPEIVNTREDGSKAVKYDKIVSLLIEGIKELKSEVDVLKEKLNHN